MNTDVIDLLYLICRVGLGFGQGWANPGPEGLIQARLSYR